MAGPGEQGNLSPNPARARTCKISSIREEFLDFPAWHYDNKGQFSVKSAYQVYIRNRDDATVATSVMPVQEVIDWKRIWKIPCQPKVQQFMWRLAHNSLPLKSSIKRKGIECDSLCVCCGRLDEDGCHLFLKCKEVKKIWREVGQENARRRLTACADAKETVQEIMKLREEDQALLACMLWKWWDRRNKINAGERVGPVETTAAQARAWALESLHGRQQVAKSSGDRVPNRWARPEGDQLKLNVDGAYQVSSGRGGWGFVIRDSAGDVRMAGAGLIQHAGSAIQTEAVAYMQALVEASGAGTSNICIESDCSNLITTLKNSSWDLAPEGVLFQDLRHFISLNFSTFAYSVVPRVCNKLAHELAAMGSRNLVNRRVLFDEVPADVSSLVATDLGVPD